MYKKLNLTRGKTLLLSLFVIFSLFFFTQQSDGGTFEQSDLGDTWLMHSLWSGGVDESGWSYGTVNINGSNGHMDWTDYEDSEGGPPEEEDTPDTVYINSDGIVAVVGDPSFHGTMSQDKNMVVGTVTGGDGEYEDYELIVLQKSGGTFEQSDLGDTWLMHSLSSGDVDDNGWSRGTVNIVEGDGSSSMTWTSFLDSDGDRSMEDTPDTVSINSDGTVDVVTVSEDNSFHGVMSLDKSMVVGTAGDIEGGRYELIVLQKSDGIEFTPTDLPGTWNMHSLESGDPGQSGGWSRGTVNINGSGIMTFTSYLDSEERTSIEYPPDTVSINSSGVVSIHNTISFHGVMSDDKNMVVATMTGGGGGGHQLIILQKSGGPIETFSKNIPGGTTASAYVMISSPVLPRNQDPLANLEDDLGSYDNTIWRLFRWNPSLESPAYEEYPFTGDDIEFGKGYWLISRDTKDIDIVGRPADTTNPYRILLSPGWNQIGNPFNVNIDWNTVQVTDGTNIDYVTDNNLTSQTLWKYENGAYSASAEMIPGEGYWIENITTDSPVSLIVNPVADEEERSYIDLLEQTLTLFAQASGEETPPPPPGGMDPESGEEGSNGGGSGCFIATACFGSPMAGEVNTLRNFRDTYLMTNPIGQLFVSTYYRYSPKVADFIAKHNFLKVVVRSSLYPIVKGCGLTVEE